jgi:hypothetical protein
MQRAMTKQHGGYDILTVPGLHGSGVGHWQTLWERAHPEYRRVEQRNWDNPQLDEWAERIDTVVATASRPVLLAAHSFGCLAVVSASPLINDRVHGALLVAPADPAHFGINALLPHALGFPTIVVASSNDPWLELTKARRLARQWGGRFVNLGAHGHINAESGFGPWPFGKLLLDELRLIAATEVRPPVAMVA